MALFLEKTMLEKLFNGGIKLQKAEPDVDLIRLRKNIYAGRVQTVRDNLPILISGGSFFDDLSYLTLSLFGQDEKRTVREFTQILEGTPFCKYQHRKIDELARSKGWKVTATYEWDSRDPRGRLDQILSDKSFYQVCIIH